MANWAAVASPVATSAAVACAGLWAGWSAYALSSLGARQGLPHARCALGAFALSAKRSERVQPPLAVLTVIAAVVAAVSANAMHGDGDDAGNWALRRDLLATAAALMLAVIVYSIVVVVPQVRRLQAEYSLDDADASLAKKDDAAVTAMLAKWGRQHALRTFLGAGTFIVAVVASQLH